MGKAPGGGTSEKIDVYLKFQQAAFKFIDGDKVKPLKVVVDGGNGMAGPMIGPLLKHLQLDLAQTFWKPDGEFPGHEPNPLLPENREFIMRKVADEGADLGIAWDGDADRCFFIDETGAFVDGDFLTALLAESLLEKSPGTTILYDVRASRAVADTVERLGGTALPNRVGHAFFKTRMREEEDAIFGGEVSGHYYFRDFYCADSGTIPALLMLELLSTRGKTPRRAARAVSLASTSSAARSTPRSTTPPPGCSRSKSTTARRARASAIWTASASTSTTGTSTSAPRTPSRCCGCAWSRSSRKRTWSAGATKCSS